MDNPSGHFVWYELMTTDMAAAETFYADVVGWEVRDASTPEQAYALLCAGNVAVGGLLELPTEATAQGATPRWMGYVGVDDTDATVGRHRELGGAVYVPPTDSNIGRISVIADPQGATLALVTGLKHGRWQKPEPGRAGGVGWHELLARDAKKALAFYAELFGWRKTDAQPDTSDTYQTIAMDGVAIGGIFNKPPELPTPCWLYYFDIDDIDAAMKRVGSRGGRVFESPFELSVGSWIVRCADAQGAEFALHGERSRQSVGWSTEWGEFSSKGRVVGKHRL